MKYIIYDDNLKSFNIFPEYLNHSDMFDKSKKLLSAGRCKFISKNNDVIISAISESVSLGCDYNVEQSKFDSEYLTRIIRVFNNI